MSTSGPTEVTPALLREWSLPMGGDSKRDRGTVLVIGGARKTPGAVVLAGIGALRAGAGRLTLAVAESVAVQVAVALPESGAVGLAENASGSVLGSGMDAIGREVESADAVLVGPGLDDGEETAGMLRTLSDAFGDETIVVLDAYALGSLVAVPEFSEALAGRLVLTPNKEEAAMLLEREAIDDVERAASEVARRYSAIVSCYGIVADPDGRTWQVSSGHAGLGTSGSGDVMAGVMVGLLARGVEPIRAACWATYLHAAAGDRLAARVGPRGFLASELNTEIPRLLVELSA